jgi:TRAP-type mannitol/chloroaromatic compound transport system substrate-binding protein
MGGWFNKRIKRVEDFKGFKMRILGVGGKVVCKFGVSVVLVPGGEVLDALASHKVDAAEWVGPASRPGDGSL